MNAKMIGAAFGRFHFGAFIMVNHTSTSHECLTYALLFAFLTKLDTNSAGRTDPHNSSGLTSLRTRAADTHVKPHITLTHKCTISFLHSKRLRIQEMLFQCLSLLLKSTRYWPYELSFRKNPERAQKPFSEQDGSKRRRSIIRFAKI